MKRVIASLVSLCLAIGAMSPCVCLAEDKDQLQTSEKLPLWEYGVVGLATRLPHYRGSEEYSNYAFPLPYFIYRGKIVKANRDGVRGIFWRSEKFQTDISMSGNPPVSDDNKARTGMPELDSLVEIGPALRYYFYELDERNSFYLQANIRMAFSIGFDDGLDTGHEGYISDLALVYKNSKLFEKSGIRFHLSTGIQFSDQELHSYFYEVEEKYATSDRPAYHVEGGYGGAHLTCSVVKKLTSDISVALFGRWINTAGAVFEDSPLVQTENNYVVSLILSYKLGESEKYED